MRTERQTLRPCVDCEQRPAEWGGDFCGVCAKRHGRYHAIPKEKTPEDLLADFEASVLRAR